MSPPERDDCPSCGATDTTPFHDQHDVPVHSCLLVDDRDAAVGFPRGDLALAVCRTCGFVFNRRFDPDNSAYSATYEETQGFSGRFRSFAEDLASRWIDRYDLRGKTVLEVGCGKGEFLELLCRMGDNRGIGIDPSFVPERMETTADVRFVRDVFRPEHAAIEADAIVCRHTLEHIPDVATFMQLVRRAVGERDDVIVLFELPDVLRVLREAAWWDLYYEHCSYFSPGSLARLFARTGFQLEDLSLDFDDQYILIEARRTTGTPGLDHPLVEPVSDVLDAVERFRRQERAVMDHWRSQVTDVRSRGGRVAIWGAGSKGVAFVHALGMDGVDVAVDINPYKQDKYLPGGGVPIVAPSALEADPPALVVAMNPIYLGEIQVELDQRGVDAELVAV